MLKVEGKKRTVKKIRNSKKITIKKIGNSMKITERKIDSAMTTPLEETTFTPTPTPSATK